MATYVNDLRLKEIATGDESGTWGTSTNTNLELIAEAFSYGTEASFGSDADATTTIADGATDPARSLYFKVTSGVSLTATRTLTLAPNDVSKVWIIENATSGSQSINISQGSGSNVTIGNGDVKIVYSDGGGASANVVDAFTDLSVTDKFKIEGSTPTLTIGDGDAEDTKLVFDGNAQDFYVGLDDSADDLVIGLGSTVGTTPAMSVDENQLATFHAGVTLTGTTPTLTIGDAGEEDTKIVFDGNAQDYYIGLDDSADDLIIGSGSTVGTTPAIIINESQQVGIGVTPTVSLQVTAADGVAANNYVGSFQNLEATSGQSFGVAIQAASSSSDIALNVANYDASAVLMRLKGSAELGIGTGTTFSNPLTTNTSGGAAGASRNQIAMTHTGASTAYHLKTIRAAATDEPAGLAFVENTTERMRIQGTGGISFNGDTAAANALDDYEEGTWTPTYSSNGGLSTVSGFTSASGFYIKIGNLVHLYGTFQMNGTSGTRIGNGDYIRLTGLPYADDYSTLTAPGNVYTTRAFTNLGGFSGICYYYAGSYMVVQFLGQASSVWSGDENALVKLELTFTDNLPY